MEPTSPDDSHMTSTQLRSTILIIINGKAKSYDPMDCPIVNPSATTNSQRRSIAAFVLSQSSPARTGIEFQIDRTTCPSFVPHSG
jgi:hypothetical protein